MTPRRTPGFAVRVEAADGRPADPEKWQRCVDAVARRAGHDSPERQRQRAINAYEECGGTWTPAEA